MKVFNNPIMDSNENHFKGLNYEMWRTLWFGMWREACIKQEQEFMELWLREAPLY